MASLHRKTIAQRYPTEGYKRLWYPVRPFMSVMIACVVLSLCWLGLLSFLPALMAILFFTLDDIIATPILSLYKGLNHLFEGRKQIKATVMLIAVGLALVLGGFAGGYLLTHLPALAHFVGEFFSVLKISPLLISLSGFLGLGLAQVTQKTSASLGFGLGLCVAFFIPIQFPLMIEAIYFSMIISAYIVSVITKQVLRGYFKLSYDHTNADGYALTRSPKQRTQFIEDRSKKLDMSVEEFVTLTEHCREKVTKIKKNATLWQEYMGIRTGMSNSYKDIYHGLMRSSLDPQEIQRVQHVMKMSRPPIKLSQEDKNMAFWASIVGYFPDARSRDVLHQYQLHECGGVDESVLKPSMVR